MFEFVQDESGLTFEATVKVNHPKHGKSEFTAEFLLVGQDEYDELAREGDAAIVERVLVGWSGVRDADKQPLPFSADVRTAMTQRAYLRTAIIRAYVAGYTGARLGN